MPGQPNTGDNNTGTVNVYLIIGLWLAIALLLFMLRPRTIRNNGENLGKSNDQVIKHNAKHKFISSF